MNIAQVMLLGLIPSAPSNGVVESAPNVFMVSPTYQDAPEEQLPKWSGSLSVGVNFTEGNSETLSASMSFDAERRGENDRYTLKGFWNYSEQEVDDDTTPDPDDTKSELTQRDFGGSLKYDYFATEKMYYNGFTGFKVDELADLDLRYYVGAGVGYQFREDEELKFAGEIGLAYTDENFEEPTAPTPSADDDFISARLATVLGWQASETARFEQSAEVFPIIDDLDDFYATVDNKLKFDLTESMFAQFQYVLDYDRTPAVGAKQADHRIIIGVGWSF